MQWNVLDVVRHDPDARGPRRQGVGLLRALVRADADDPEAVVATCDYGGAVVAAVERATSSRPSSTLRSRAPRASASSRTSSIWRAGRRARWSSIRPSTCGRVRWCGSTRATSPRDRVRGRPGDRGDSVRRRGRPLDPRRRPRCGPYRRASRIVAVIGAIAAAVGDGAGPDRRGSAHRRRGRCARGGGCRSRRDRHRRGRGPCARGASRGSPAGRGRTRRTATARWRCGDGSKARATGCSTCSPRFADVGVDAFIVTDISRDGTLAGPDLEGLAQVLDRTTLAVIASGGRGRGSRSRRARGLEVNGRRPRERSSAARLRGPVHLG